MYFSQKLSEPTSKKNRNCISLVPCGINRLQPYHFLEIPSVAWENHDSLDYAWRILRDGCWDGCAPGTKGMGDWTMEGAHLCEVRLQLMRYNTMPAMDWRLLEDADALRGMTEWQVRKRGGSRCPWSGGGATQDSVAFRGMRRAYSWRVTFGPSIPGASAGFALPVG